MIFDDAIEQNRKVALSVISGYDGFNIEVDDDFDTVNVVVDYGYLRDNFNYLFVDNFFYNSAGASYDDMSGEAVEHVTDVVENLHEYDDNLYEVQRKIHNHSDYISECEGIDLTVGYYVDVSDRQIEALAEDLQEIEFGY